MAQIRLFAALAAAALAGATAAHAQAGSHASVVTNGSLTVLEPLAITQESAFGGPVARPAGAGSVEVPGATYTVRGLAGETFNVTTPSSIKLHRVGGADQIQMTLTPSQTAGQLPGHDGLPVSTTIGLHGAAPINPSTAGGVYTGEYGLTIAYP